MSLPTYQTGIVSVSNGGTTVIGVGSIWSGTNARQGDWISIDGSDAVLVTAVTDTTHLEIPPWGGANKVGVPYVLYQNFAARVVGVGAAEDVSALVAALNKQGFFVFVGPAEAVPDPSLGEEGQYARKPSTGEEWLKIGGLWVFQGVFGNLTATDTPWSGATTYAAKVIVPFAGKLWRSLQASNLNHQPDMSPTWWALFLSGGDTVFIAMDDSDRPASGEVVLKFVSPKPTTFYAAMTDSFANATVGATLSAVYSIKKNGIEFATATFAAAGQAGPQSATFACAADAVFAAGDILTIVAPALRDATLSGVGITLTAYRSS